MARPSTAKAFFRPKRMPRCRIGLLKAILFLALGLVIPLRAMAGDITVACKVTKVVDGDTFHCEVPGYYARILTVRMSGIDAPEADQLFGASSKANLENALAGKLVQINVDRADRYGRFLCEVFLGGMNVNEWMVRNGYAWVYRENSKGAHLLSTEAAARKARLGLWRDAGAVYPGHFRSGKFRNLVHDTGTSLALLDTQYGNGNNLPSASTRASSGGSGQNGSTGIGASVGGDLFGLTKNAAAYSNEMERRQAKLRELSQKRSQSVDERIRIAKERARAKLKGGSAVSNTVNKSLCPSCSELASCEQAHAYLNSGCAQLDEDGDGIPCANLCMKPNDNAPKYVVAETPTQTADVSFPDQSPAYVEPLASPGGQVGSNRQPESGWGGSIVHGCPSCDELSSCQDAMAYFNSGCSNLDMDGDGTPCPSHCAPKPGNSSGSVLASSSNLDANGRAPAPRRLVEGYGHFTSAQVSSVAPANAASKRWEPLTPSTRLKRCPKCSMIATCEEAYSYLNAGCHRLDGDKDGVPCENLCRSRSPVGQRAFQPRRQANVAPRAANGTGFKRRGSCPTCRYMSSCREAYEYLYSGCYRLDGDGDGVPCEKMCR